MIYVINAITVLLLGVIWSKNNWFNFFIKMSLITLSGANAFYALQHFGYILKV
jgi:hypothetical protein